jgi:hypothetical protein
VEGSESLDMVGETVQRSASGPAAGVTSQVRRGGGDPAPAGKEGFLARQRRKLVRADFRQGEVLAPAEHVSTTLARYCRAGRVGQFFDRVWAWIAILVGISWVLAGVALVGQPLGWRADIGGVALAALGAYVSLYHLAGWRCMRRYRRRGPRRTG